MFNVLLWSSIDRFSKQSLLMIILLDMIIGVELYELASSLFFTSNQSSLTLVNDPYI